MTLASGIRLGPYEIQALIGAGGMGEVYRARDTRLHRSVAIKVLPEKFSGDEHRQRFEREARAISALTHPHICTLHDIGHENGIDYLVMEYCEGESLAARIDKGPMAIEQVLRHGIEIAAALDRAHAAGIIHRDLKPGNVMMTKQGAKLLDFGLAKIAFPAEHEVDSIEETARRPLTASGVIVGTLQYMSPEQLEGSAVDARTDIFAFGVVLYEMITGRSAFPTSNRNSMIGAILRSDPAPIEEIRPDTPPLLEHLVSVALAKAPADRWQCAHDMLLQLEAIAQNRLRKEAEIGSPRKRERIWMALAALLAVGLAVALFTIRKPKPVEPAAARFQIQISREATFYPFTGPPALSPDGTHLAYFTHVEGQYVLSVRALNSLEAKMHSGARGGAFPFWSPDGKSIAYWGNGKISLVDKAGGLPQPLCDFPPWPVGGTWASDGTILLGQSGKGLLRTTTKCDKSVPLTQLDGSRQEIAHVSPQFLPDGRRFIFLARSAKPELSSILIGSLDSEETKRIAASHSIAAYADPGFLVFVRDRVLVAQRFNLETLEVEGDPVPIADSIAEYEALGVASFSVSKNGILAYATRGNSETQIMWVDRRGELLSTVGERGEHIHIELSPDEKFVAVESSDPVTSGAVMSRIDLARGITSRLTVENSWGGSPIWSPDGTRVAFFSGGRRGLQLQETLAGGGGEKRVLTDLAGVGAPADWSPDGRYIAYYDTDTNNAGDIRLLPQFGDGKPTPYLQTAANEMQARFSSNGRWIAYTSDESGRIEVYVRSFPATDEKWQISASGGSQPRWRADGKELFFIGSDKRLMSVEIDTSRDFQATAPRTVFQTNVRRFFARNDYGVSRDGQRFLINSAVFPKATSDIVVITNWTAELK